MRFLIACLRRRRGGRSSRAFRIDRPAVLLIRTIASCAFCIGHSRVVFDYGMVLTDVPDTKAHDAMVRITGLPVDQFERLYWNDRHAYDEGKLSGIAILAKNLREARLDLTRPLSKN